ncbi:uncharacterized protein LOC112505641 [Cynara cardunculus var. scolymus]|uniref:uncharacterized protein LOC112505641 n=1 Tax=Cynara cardunculus var. scolymus TaxID=59895 RepID=UPI000D628C8E|nr:uncharacterized protein LOC112505641 [Cynara cardunculus var. scolymus]
MAPSPSSAQHRPHSTSLRNSLSWLFLSLFFLYILYYSTILFEPAPVVDTTTRTTTTNTTTDCHDHLSAAENLQNPISSSNTTIPEPLSTQPVLRFDTELKHIAFGIAASSRLWRNRKEYIKLWWRRGETRGAVWLDKHVKTMKNESLPDIHISEDTSKFPYTNPDGDRSAIRISRVVSETLRLEMEDVRWFVMGDDDTVFIVENLVRVLSKYDHNQFYYIGSTSESHFQNMLFSYGMAFGGGGFAISYPLAVELEKMQDRCLHRYPGYYGSDDRMHGCMAELNVPLTREPGFHQFDVHGNLLGLLAAHPVTPFVSLHHLDVVDPIFPGMTRAQGIKHLLQSTKYDSASIIQQSIGYDKKRQWSILVSWGFAIQIIRGILSPRELEIPTRTFLNWHKRLDYTAYAFNTRPVTRNPCQKPFVYYMSSTRYDKSKGKIIGIYTLHKERYPHCKWKMESPETIDTIVVLKKEDNLRWTKAPRKDCCRVLPARKKGILYLWVGNCRKNEVIEL